MTLHVAQRAIVVDASVAVPFLAGATALVDRWRAWISGGDMLLVPAHFPIEVANALLRGSSVIAPDDVLPLMGRLLGTGFEVADRGVRGIERSIGLAQRHRLTVYDAAYLDLAIDVDAELATEDRALRKAAEAEGVPLAS